MQKIKIKYMYTTEIINNIFIGPPGSPEHIQKKKLTVYFIKNVHLKSTIHRLFFLNFATVLFNKILSSTSLSNKEQVSLKLADWSSNIPWSSHRSKLSTDARTRIQCSTICLNALELGLSSLKGGDLTGLTQEDEIASKVDWGETVVGL